MIPKFNLNQLKEILKDFHFFNNLFITFLDSSAIFLVAKHQEKVLFK